MCGVCVLVQGEQRDFLAAIVEARNKCEKAAFIRCFVALEGEIQEWETFRALQLFLLPPLPSFPGYRQSARF